jgi:hypothetical protein
MRLAAIMLLFKEEAFVEASVRAIYPVVDAICGTSAHDRNFSGESVKPDQTLEVLLRVPDPENKVKVVVQRDLSQVPGLNSEARLRNAAMALEPQADYYLIVDTDEIWSAEVLRRCWEEVQRTQWAAYRISSYTYFRKWNCRGKATGRWFFCGGDFTSRPTARSSGTGRRGGRNICARGASRTRFISRRSGVCTTVPAWVGTSGF